MATSLQKDQLKSKILATLGEESVDFSTYNYKATKPIQTLVDIINSTLSSVFVRVMGSELSKIDVLHSFTFQGDYSKLSKPQLRALREISSVTVNERSVSLRVGWYDAGFDGVVAASLILRHAMENNLKIEMIRKDHTATVDALRKQLEKGVPADLSEWTSGELYYIFRACAINDRYVSFLAENGDEEEYVDVNLTNQGRLQIKIQGPVVLDGHFGIRIEDGNVSLDPVSHTWEKEQFVILNSWLYARGKNLEALYKEAEFKRKRAELKERLATGNETMEVIRQLVIASSQIACSKTLGTKENFEELDKLVEQYSNLRKRSQEV